MFVNVVTLKVDDMKIESNSSTNCLNEVTLLLRDVICFCFGSRTGHTCQLVTSLPPLQTNPQTDLSTAIMHQ